MCFLSHLQHTKTHGDKTVLGNGQFLPALLFCVVCCFVLFCSEIDFLSLALAKEDRVVMGEELLRKHKTDHSFEKLK